MGGTIRTSQNAAKAHKFRSGPYLNKLFAASRIVEISQQRDICGRIKQGRTEAGFTLQDAADALEITLRAYQNYEANRVPFRRLAEIAVLFNVTQDWILRGDLSPEKIDPDRIRGLEVLVAALAEDQRLVLDLLREIRGDDGAPGQLQSRKS